MKLSFYFPTPNMQKKNFDFDLKNSICEYFLTCHEFHQHRQYV